MLSFVFEGDFVELLIPTSLREQGECEGFSDEECRSRPLMLLDAKAEHEWCSRPVTLLFFTVIIPTNRTASPRISHKAWVMA